MLQRNRVWKCPYTHFKTGYEGTHLWQLFTSHCCKQGSAHKHSCKSKPTDICRGRVSETSHWDVTMKHQEVQTQWVSGPLDMSMQMSQKADADKTMRTQTFMQQMFPMALPSISVLWHRQSRLWDAFTSYSYHIVCASCTTRQLCRFHFHFLKRDTLFTAYPSFCKSRHSFKKIIVSTCIGTCFGKTCWRGKLIPLGILSP